ncbi:MAG: RNA 2',3'-cyclic phosphodiesterase [Thermoleophilaceae bacterium]|nr:RNA 2',3'-cyclic phosphodiesterase [Thermoleophilaceae bacterium]
MSPRETQRLFIAVDPPVDLAQRLAEWAGRELSGVPHVRLIPPEDIHLTLAFLGERTADEIALITEAMLLGAEQITETSDEFMTDVPLLLPTTKPRVLAVQVVSRIAMQYLRNPLIRELESRIELRNESRFRPHFTVARMREGTRLDPSPTRFPVEEVKFSEFVLYRSFLEPSGARYEAVERVALP